MTELARIRKVDVDENEKKVFVDVIITPNRAPTGIPYRMPGKGVWVVPEVGDVVEIDKVGNSNWVAFAPKSPPSFSMPSSLSEGDVAIKVSENAYIHLDKNDDGTVDLEIDVDGDILLGANGLRAADENHTHPVTLSDGSTTTTGSPSSGDLTDTKIE